MGKESNITASERVVGEGLEHSVKGKWCYFYRTNTSLCIFWEMFSFTPAAPLLPQRQPGLASAAAQQGAGGHEGGARGCAQGLSGGERHKSGVRDAGRKPPAPRRIAQRRKKPDPVAPVYTGPGAGGAHQERSWGAQPAREARGRPAVCVKARGCQTEEEEEARKKAASNVIY